MDRKRKQLTSHPVILKEGHYSVEDVEKLKSSAANISDIYLFQHKELFEIRNPQLIFSSDFVKKQERYIDKIKNKSLLKGNWVFFPWKSTLIHTVTEENYYELRTNRNRKLIKKSEQLIIRDKKIGIAGLSIGVGVAFNLVHQGIGNNFRLAEYDTLETTNLNRVASSICDVGELKMELAKRRLFELDPYIKIDSFDDGLDEKNLNQFLKGKEKLDLVIEAIDDLKLKIKIRLEARKAGIPVIMFTNLGDSVLIDIERFDIDKSIPLFNGAVGNTPEKILKHKITKDVVNKFVTALVSKENTPLRAMETLQSIGIELVGRPQLSSTVAISGGLSAYIARRIFLSEKIESGRYLFKFESIFKNQ